MINLPTDWIRDIDLDPRILRNLADKISDAVEDEISDICWQLSMDYLPAPPEFPDSESMDQYEDAVSEKVISPLYDRILLQVIDHLIGVDAE